MKIIRRKRNVQAVQDGAARPQKRLRRQGVTLLEILVVLIIIGVIAGVVGVQMLGEAERAKADATKVQISSIRSALDLYRLHNGVYPSTEQGLSALITRPELGTPPRNWQGPYLNSNKVPADSWNNAFVYLNSTGRYVVISLGADGLEGGTDLDADISSDDM